MTNEVKNEPELRFPEFECEWIEKKLGELLSFSNGINASKEQYGSGIKFINVLDILNNNFILSENIIGKVDVSQNIEERNKVEYGDIVFLRSSETREEVGLCNVYLDKENHALFGGFVIRGKRCANYHPFFLKLLLNNSSVRKSISSLAGGSTRFNISQDILNSIKVWLTEISEQQKIGAFFSKLDRQIELEEQKLEKLKEQKKGYMQQIFSKELRFKDDDGNDYPKWEEINLGSLYKMGKAGGTPKSTESKYYNGEIPFLSISDITKQGKFLHSTEKKITQEGLDNSTAWLVPVNSINYAMYASVGYLSINKIGVATSQAIFNMVFEDYNLVEYLYYYLNHIRDKGVLEKLMGTGTQSNLSASIMKNISVKRPSKSEMIKINTILSNIDELICSQIKKIELLKKRKQGFLQKMFV